MPSPRLWIVPVLMFLALFVISLTGCGSLDASDPWSEKTYYDDLYTNNMTYTGTYWDDLRTPVTSVKVPGAKYPEWKPSYGGLILNFSNQAVEGNEEEVYLVMQLPHTYKEGTDVVVHVHYAFEADRVGETGRWGLEYTWTNMDEAITASDTVYADTVVTDGTDVNIHFLANFTTLDGTDMDISSIVVARLFRNSSVDTYTSGLQLLEIDAHFQVDAPGSKGEITK